MAPTAQFLIAAALTLSSASGASSIQTDDEGDPRCVLVRGVSGYSVIDDRHMLLQGGASRYYLVTTRTRCSGLRSGVSIGLSFADTARICTPVTEYLIPDDGWRCAIDTVVEVESEDAARALIEQRAQTAAPQDD